MYELILSLYWLLVSSSLIFFYQDYAIELESKNSRVNLTEYILILFSILIWPFSLLLVVFAQKTNKQEFKNRIILSFTLPLILLVAYSGQCLSSIKEFLIVVLIFCSLVINFTILGFVCRKLLETYSLN